MCVEGISYITICNVNFYSAKLIITVNEAKALYKFTVHAIYKTNKFLDTF